MNQLGVELLFILASILVSLNHQNVAAFPQQPRKDVCTMTPMATEGPYYIKNVLNRGDIRDGKEGIPLNLTIQVVNGKSCDTLSNLRVDIWHCDGLGQYSGFSQQASFGGGQRWAGIWDGNDGRPDRWADFPRRPRGPPPKVQPSPSVSPASLFLRGYQSTDARGLVNFQTIVPAWYPGRSMHIHFEIRNSEDQIIHVGQFFFDETLSQTVEKVHPYNSISHKRMKNTEDGVFKHSHGDQTILEIVGDVSGMASNYQIGVDATVIVDINDSSLEPDWPEFGN